MNKYANTNIRPGKTDNKDAITIANYGIDYWYKLQYYVEKDTRYEQLNYFLGNIINILTCA
jgi:hypothetical protein